MKKTLVIAATAGEIAPFMQLPPHQREAMDTLITGVGMVATAYALGKQLNTQRYDLLLNVGIAGTFNRNIPLATVVRVQQDTFTELGAQDGEQFIDSEALKLGSHTYYGDPGFNHPAITKLRSCKGITVNQVHGNEASIASIVNRIHPDTESMEGAAVFYAAHQAGLPAVQVRAISNYVERRNKDNWQIGQAIANLNHWLISFARSNGEIAG